MNTMMRERDKPFILYRSGRWSFRIVPRNGEGWRQAALWWIIGIPIPAAFVWYSAGEGSDPASGFVLAAFLAAMLVWAVAGILWMKARAEEVHVSDLIALKREQERKRRKR